MACQHAEHAVAKAGKKQLGAKKFRRLRQHAENCAYCWDYIMYLRWCKVKG